MFRLIRNLLWLGLMSWLPVCEAYAVTQTRSALPQVTALEIEGNLAVTLHTNRPATRVLLRGDQRDLARVSTTVKQGVLRIQYAHRSYYIGKKPRQHAVIHVDVSVGDLRRLAYRGKGLLVGRNLRTRSLVLWLKNSGQTRLEGQLALRALTVVGPGQVQLSGVSGTQVILQLVHSPKVQLKGVLSIASLDVSGKGLFSAYWLNSPKLKLRARDEARIQLAGITGELDLELWDQAQFNGRYLRVAESFVKTHDQALAELATTEQQHSIAYDSSDVYFYNLATTRNDFMAESGAALDMRELNFPALAEYNTYNK